LVERTTDWTANRIFALVLGIVLLLIGIIGFFTPTKQYGVQEVFGLFDVDVVHNLIHVVSGILGIAAAFMGWSRTFNRTFGIIYVVLGLVGLIPALYFPSGAFGHDNGLFLGLTHINAADHILHLVIGLAAVAVGFMMRDDRVAPATTTGSGSDPMVRP
jgi:Domain of unknown function (DUF4383)